MIRRRWIGPIGLLAGLGLSATACGARYGMPDPGTAQGEATLSLWNTFMVIGAIVAAIVYGLIAWSIIAHRRKRSDPKDIEGASFRENLPLEIVYTAIPVVIVIALFLMSLRTDQTVTGIAEEPDQTVHVEAYTWGWRFTYEDGTQVVSEPIGDNTTVGEGPALTLPEGKTTRIVLTANDTIHAFWVPGFLFKRDAIPGRVTEFDVTPTRTGTYHGACAELCGWNHAYMTFHVDVLSPADYEAWVANQPTQSPASSATPAPPSPVEAA